MARCRPKCGKLTKCCFPIIKRIIDRDVLQLTVVIEKLISVLIKHQSQPWFYIMLNDVHFIFVLLVHNNHFRNIRLPRKQSTKNKNIYKQKCRG